MKHKKYIQGDSGLLMHIKKDAPKLWRSLKLAQADGLLFIDEKTDAITATNRLLFTYPDLHETINQIVDHWTLRKDDIEFSQLDFLVKEFGDNK